LQFLIVIIGVAVTALPVVGYNGYGYYAPFNDNDTYCKQLILNIYVDETGKALVTGYVEHEDIEFQNPH
jgi:hypothetical protein